MALIDKLTSIADVIRLRTGNTNKMTLDEMANTVGKMSDCSNDTVTPGALALGVTAHDKNGALITGSLSVDCGYGPNDLVAGTTPLAAGSYYFLVNEAHRSVGNVYVGDENGVASLWAEREIHTWSLVDRIDPSCTVDGCDIYSCDCGETKRENVVVAPGHKYTSVVTAPTCTAQGYTTHTCSNCGDKYTDSVTNARGHSYGSAYSSSEFSTGYGQKCSRCGHLKAMNKPLSVLAVGSSVFMNVNGVKAEFLVVHQGIPDATRYDSSCNGTWLLKKYCDTSVRMLWDSVNETAYPDSDVNEYLNGTFINGLDSGIKNIIKQVKLSYANYKTLLGPISTKVFLLSRCEVQGDSTYTANDGAILSYFSDNTNDKRVATYLDSGDKAGWWLRTVDRKHAFCIDSDGGVNMYYMNSRSSALRPAFVLPSTTPIDGTLISTT